MSSTKQQILDAALDLFSQQGFHGTSIREIAEQVEIRKSSIYNHFSGKQAILDQLFASFGGATVKEKLTSQRLQKKINQPYEFFTTLVEEVVAELKDEREQKFMRLILKESVNKQEGKLIEENIELLADILTEMMEQGLIKECNPEIAAREFVGPLILLRLEHLQLNVTEGGVDKLAQLAQQHVDFFWQAVKKE